MSDQPPPPPTTPSAQSPSTPNNPYQPSGTAGGKQGLPWWAWLGLGCGCLVIIGVLTAVLLFGWGATKVAEFAGDLENDPAAAVELMVRMNPEIELVETDRESGKITVRDKDSGKEATFDFSEIKQGKISFEGEGGKTTFSSDGESMNIEGADGEKVRIGAGVELDDVPDWVELYPGAQSQGGATSSSADGAQGWLTMQTEDSAEEAEAFYQDFFDRGGWEVSRQTMTTNEGRVVVLNGRSESGERELVATFTRAEGQPTQVMLRYASGE